MNEHLFDPSTQAPKKECGNPPGGCKPGVSCGCFSEKRCLIIDAQGEFTPENDWIEMKYSIIVALLRRGDNRCTYITGTFLEENKSEGKQILNLLALAIQIGTCGPYEAALNALP